MALMIGITTMSTDKFKKCSPLIVLNLAATFVQHVASIASELSHYPEILMKGSNVTVTSTTSDDNGVTDNDIALAESIEILVTG